MSIPMPDTFFILLVIRDEFRWKHWNQIPSDFKRDLDTDPKIIAEIHPCQPLMQQTGTELT